MININKPKSDIREFAGGQLENGIKYALVNDKTLEKSYVTIVVNVGSYSNPKDYDGLAHFLEHMLFMGSKKYPDEKYYFEELNKLGGNSNAYTASMETVYFFNVFDNGLERMFDIFSRFFIDPLFNKDSISREINAVNSEHKKNINSDMWRKHQFMLDILNKDSSMNNFGTGSLNTLDKKDIRDKLIEFYNNYYTTDNISICIASSKSFEDMKGIIDSTFGIIKKSICENKLELNKPFYSENKLNTYYFKTLSNIYNITYIFEIPNQHKYLKSRYFSIFEMILLNKSDKSLYFNLTSMGYINNINIEIKYEGVLEITLTLTSEGLNHLDYIESSLYQAIEQIINSDINKYATYFKKILKINYANIYKFETTELCNMLAVNHYYYKTKDIFKGPFIIKKIKSNKKYKHKFIKYINKNNIIKIISSQDFPFDEKLKYNKTREYNAEYALINLDLTPINNDNILYDQFDFNNNYLDVNPRVIPDLDIYDIPRLISNNQWYGGCSKFGEPLVTILLQINNNKYFESAINYTLTQISCWILNYLINVIMYKPFELSYSITFIPVPSTSSINIIISALNDVSKIKLLLNDLNNFLFNIDLSKLSENYINNLIVSLKETYENINFLNPSSYSINKIRSYIYDTEYPIEQLISATKIINFNKIKEYIKTILNDSTMTSFVYGNIDEKDASSLLVSYNKYFNNSSLTIPITHYIQEINVKHPNPNEKSNSVTLFYSMGEINIKDNNDATKSIIAVIGTRILSQLFFDELRTKQQLGYLVNLSMSAYRRKYYVVQKIQSDKPIDYIIDHINKFNKNVGKYLLDSEFNEFVESIKKELLEPEYSLSDKVNKYLPEITSHEYIFDRNIILSKYIDKITKEDVVSYFNELLLKPIKVIINGN
jgi:insulysin